MVQHSAQERYAYTYGGVHAAVHGPHTFLPHDKRVTTEALPQGFHRVRAYYGFMERPDVQEIVAICRDLGLNVEAEETAYYLGRAELLSTGPAPMMRWRKRLFSLMSRNASAATDFFNIAPNRVVELGARRALPSVQWALSPVVRRGSVPKSDHSHRGRCAPRRALAWSRRLRHPQRMDLHSGAPLLS
jgi:hypothetical protein